MKENSFMIDWEDEEEDDDDEEIEEDGRIVRGDIEIW